MARTVSSVFTAAPHRVMMFGGALQLIGALLFWAAEMSARYLGWPTTQTVISSTAAHGFLMLYCVFTFFIFGFLMTTYPRWMNGEAVPRRRYVTVFALLFGGVGITYVGLFTARGVIVSGAVLFLAGHLAGMWVLWKVYRGAPAADKHYERILNVALILGATGIGAYLAWLYLEGWYLLEIARQVGTWGLMVTVLITVSHRMLPFFTGAVPGTAPVRQPRGGLAPMLVCAWTHGLLGILNLAAWQWVVDLPLAVVAGYHLGQWGFVRSHRVRLLSMLHIAFVWFVLAMVLFAVRSLVVLVTGLDYLGRAPLHALGIGFFVGMTLAMATRVTLGHSGRVLEADTYTWMLFWGVGVSAVVRILGEFPALAVVAGIHLNVVAVALLLVVVGLWGLRYIPMYVLPRADGKPG